MFLILDTYNPDTLYLDEQESEDLWFFEQKVGETLVYMVSDVLKALRRAFRNQRDKNEHGNSVYCSTDRSFPAC
jgi:hypothetical protein